MVKKKSQLLSFTKEYVSDFQTTKYVFSLPATFSCWKFFLRSLYQGHFPSLPANQVIVRKLQSITKLRILKEGHGNRHLVCYGQARVCGRVGRSFGAAERKALTSTLILSASNKSEETVICRTALPYLHVVATQSPLPRPFVHQYAAVVKAERSPTVVQKKQLFKFQVKFNPHNLQPFSGPKRQSWDWLEKQGFIKQWPGDQPGLCRPSLATQATGGRS